MSRRTTERKKNGAWKGEDAGDLKILAKCVVAAPYGVLHRAAEAATAAVGGISHLSS